MKARRRLDQRLKLQHLRCIEAIAASGSLLKASAALGLTQPALSKALREAESVVGKPLFERHSRGVRLTGTDAWSWDAPFLHTARRYAQTHDASLIWEGHKAGRDIGYCHLEKLHNLEVLPPTGFFISCFPHKIRGASAGWTRAVAIFDDRLTGA